MKRINLLSLLFFVSIFNSFSQVSVNEYVDFIPISPVQINSNIISTSSYDEVVSLSTTEMSRDKKTVINFIPNESMETTIQSFSEDGKVSYIYSGRSVKKGIYRLVVDYNKHIIQNIETSSEEACVGYAKIGIGLRIVANINALRNNIDISSLVAIGNAAKKGFISGTVGYEVIGIESKEITAILPINSEITSSINQVFLQAIGAVKGKIYDNETRLHPQIIAVKHTGCETTASIVKSMMKQYGKNKVIHNEDFIVRN